jgi:predicted nucleic acid-binding protein
LLVDTNVVLDVLLDREPFAEPAARVLTAVEIGQVEGILGATTVTTAFYLAQRARDGSAARKHVARLLDLFLVAAVDGAVLRSALRLDFDDYEDAVLHEAAKRAGAVGIVTRDRTGFESGTLPVYDPEELLAVLAALSDQDEDSRPD